MLLFGDVHGCHDTLLALLDKIPDEHKEDLCFCGDLVDRGPKSMQVIEFVQDNGHYCVLGNHDQWMAEDGEFCIQEKNRGAPWMRNDWIGQGGKETILSYDLDDEVTDTKKFLKHAEYLKTLPPYIHFPDVKNSEGRELVASHSLVLNYWDNIQKNGMTESVRNNILWNRNYHKLKDPANIHNVVGHTIFNDGPRLKKIYSNLDTGCFLGLHKWKQHCGPYQGKLTALHYESGTIYQQECID